MKGCLGCLVVAVGMIVVLHVGSCIFTVGEIELSRLKTWHNKRMAEKAEKEAREKARKVEAERAAADKRKEMEAAAKLKREEELKKAQMKKRQESKDEKIRTFALQELPRVWRVYQDLGSEVVVVSNRISDLRKTLLTFGKIPDHDDDFNQICAMCEEMMVAHASLRRRLEDAYIAKCKFEATPGRRDYEEQHRRALENGIKDAAVIAEKFKEIRMNK